MGEGIQLPPVAASVAAARRWVDHLVSPVAGPEAAETTALLVSELVSNVVLHARTTCEVWMEQGETSVRVEVRDHSERLPDLDAHREPLALSGRGLLLVSTLSAAHGVERHADGGKSVWFEIRVPAVELR